MKYLNYMSDTWNILTTCFGLYGHLQVGCENWNTVVLKTISTAVLLILCSPTQRGWLTLKKLWTQISIGASESFRAFLWQQASQVLTQCWRPRRSRCASQRLHRGCGNYRCQYRNFCFVLDGVAALSQAFVNLLKLLYVTPGLKFKNSTWCSLCVECFYGSQNRQRPLLFTSLSDLFL